MKPTLQQEENLRTYLADILKYRETIDEVYDHVLTAVEEKSENVRFQDAVNQVLNDDFGGNKGLVKTERQRLRDATWEGFVQISKYIKSDFEYPNIFYTLLIFAISYYTTINIVLNGSSVAFLPLYIILLVSILKLGRTFFIGYYKSDTRKSIQDRVAVRMYIFLNYSSLYFVMFRSIIPSFYHFIFTDHPSIFASVLTIYLLCIYASVRISINEFKPYFAK